MPTRSAYAHATDWLQLYPFAWFANALSTLDSMARVYTPVLLLCKTQAMKTKLDTGLELPACALVHDCLDIGA